MNCLSLIMIGAKLPTNTQQELIEVFALRNGIKITHTVIATVEHVIESCLLLRAAESPSIWCAPIVTTDLPTAAELIDLGVPVFYCGSERVVVQRCASRVESAKPIQVQPKVTGVGSVINLVGRGEPIEPIPAGRVTFAKPLPKNSKVAERATRIKMAAQESRSCDLDMDLLRYAMMTGDASAEPTKAAEAKKPKRGRALPKKQSYPYRDENGNLWVSAVKKLSPRFIFLYKDIARHVSLFTADGMTMDAISEKLGYGGFKVSATTVWVIQQGIKAGAWPHLK
jgi:hypothetical protein